MAKRHANRVESHSVQAISRPKKKVYCSKIGRLVDSLHSQTKPIRIFAFETVQFAYCSW